MKTKSGNKKKEWEYTHQAVALLFGAAKRTVHPMSLQLVTDHGKNNKLDYRVSELQFLTQGQNLVKGRGMVFPDGLEPIKPARVAGGGW